MYYSTFPNQIKTKEEADKELSINKIELNICGFDAFGALLVTVDVDAYDRWDLIGIIPYNVDKNKYYIKSFIIYSKGVYYLREFLHQALLVINAIEFLNPEEKE